MQHDVGSVTDPYSHGKTENITAQIHLALRLPNHAPLNSQRMGVYITLSLCTYLYKEMQNSQLRPSRQGRATLRTLKAHLEEPEGHITEPPP